jgi:hypothetical protein
MHAWPPVVTIVVAAAVIGLVALATSWFGAPTAGDTTFAGTYTSDTDLRVANLTIPGGHVTAGYSVDVLFLPQGSDPSGIRCGIVDTSGRLELFEPSRTTAAPGQWVTLAFDANYILPELTLGLRCSPNSDGAATVVFRDAELHVTPLP